MKLSDAPMFCQDCRELQVECICDEHSDAPMFCQDCRELQVECICDEHKENRTMPDSTKSIQHPRLPEGCKVYKWTGEGHQECDFELLLWPVRETIVKFCEVYPHTSLIFLVEHQASMYFNEKWDIEDVQVHNGLVMHVKTTVDIPNTRLPMKGEF